MAHATDTPAPSQSAFLKARADLAVSIRREHSPEEIAARRSRMSWLRVLVHAEQRAADIAADDWAALISSLTTYLTPEQRHELAAELAGGDRLA